jgi:uncharacterized membrane protein
MFYREIFHLLGAVLFVIFSILISSRLFHSELLPVFLIGFIALALAFQEFYFHPKKYKQTIGKGIIDWMVWIFPMVIYFLYFA